MRRFLKRITLAFAYLGVMILPVAVFAANATQGGVPNPLGEIDSFTELVTAILQKVVLPIGTTVVVFFIIYSGFLFVTAQGNEEKLTKAKTAIIWTIVGAAVLFGATVFSTLICETVKDLGVPVQCSL